MKLSKLFLTIYGKCFIADVNMMQKLQNKIQNGSIVCILKQLKTSQFRFEAIQKS